MRLHIFDGPFRFHRAGRAGNPQRVVNDTEKVLEVLTNKCGEAEDQRRDYG